MHCSLIKTSKSRFWRLIKCVCTVNSFFIRSYIAYVINVNVSTNPTAIISLFFTSGWCTTKGVFQRSRGACRQVRSRVLCRVFRNDVRRDRWRHSGSHRDCPEGRWLSNKTGKVLWVYSCVISIAPCTYTETVNEVYVILDSCFQIWKLCNHSNQISSTTSIDI